MSIKAILGDITTLAVDVIVNAANRSLKGGGGVDGAIHRVAGPKLARVARLHAPCPTGHAVVTRGFGLPARWCIHTVGPVWPSAGKKRFGVATELAACYRNSLVLACRVEAKSIAFPCISTGAYGFPREAAARIAIDTVRKHLAESGVQEVVFCCYLQEDFDLYQQLLQGEI
jgi:O-acetyl-ADP-ribose deacetylase (regulator of RNase III)